MTLVWRAIGVLQNESLRRSSSGLIARRRSDDRGAYTTNGIAPIQSLTCVGARDGCGMNTNCRVATAVVKPGLHRRKCVKARPLPGGGLIVAGCACMPGRATRCAKSCAVATHAHPRCCLLPRRQKLAVDCAGHEEERDLILATLT